MVDGMYEYLVPAGTPPGVGAPLMLDASTVIYGANNGGNPAGGGIISSVDLASGQVNWSYPTGPGDVAYGTANCPAQPVALPWDQDTIAVYFNRGDPGAYWTQAVLLDARSGAETNYVVITDQFGCTPACQAFSFGQAIIFRSNYNIWGWFPGGFNGTPTNVIEFPTDFTNSGVDVVIEAFATGQDWLGYTYQQSGTWHFARTALKADGTKITHQHEGRLDHTYAANVVPSGALADPYASWIWVTVGGAGAECNTAQKYDASAKSSKTDPAWALYFDTSPIGSTTIFADASHHVQMLTMMDNDLLLMTPYDLAGPAKTKTITLSKSSGKALGGPVIASGSSAVYAFVQGTNLTGDGCALYWADTQGPSNVMEFHDFGNASSFIGTAAIGAETLALVVWDDSAKTSTICAIPLSPLIG